MVSEISNGPCDFVLFGTKGDLARRKLLPSLFQLEKANLLDPATRILGVARQDVSLDEYVAMVRENIESFGGEEICEETWLRFYKRLDYVCVDMMNIEKIKGKDNILATLKKSNEFILEKVGMVENDKFGEEVDFGFGKFSRLSGLLIILEHNGEHKGQLIAYARSNGVTPPWSK